MTAAVLGALAVANSATNPFVFLAFNTSWACLKSRLGAGRAGEGRGGRGEGRAGGGRGAGDVELRSCSLKTEVVTCSAAANQERVNGVTRCGDSLTGARLSGGDRDSSKFSRNSLEATRRPIPFIRIRAEPD